MLSLGVGLTSVPVLARRGGGLAAALLGNEPAGLAFDFTDLSGVIRDPGTPANGWQGDANAKLNYASPSTKWIWNRQGALEAGTALRCEYDPATGQPLGVRIESQRTNLFLNSAVGVTQSVTVTAVAHTLSFYGTGTVTLSGASTAGPLTGTGPKALASLTFTPAAGSLALTVTGSVTNVNLEVGASASSYILTTASQVTRAADKVTLPVSAFPYSATVSVVTQDIRPFPGAIAGDAVAIWSGTNANALSGYQQGGSAFVSTARASGSNVFVHNLGNPPANTFFRVATRYQVGNAASVRTNGTVMAPAMATMPAGLTEMILGSQGLAAAPSYWIRSLRYIPRAASDAELQAWVA